MSIKSKQFEFKCTSLNTSMWCACWKERAHQKAMEETQQEVKELKAAQETGQREQEAHLTQVEEATDRVASLEISLRERDRELNHMQSLVRWVTPSYPFSPFPIVSVLGGRLCGVFIFFFSSARSSFIVHVLKSFITVSCHLNLGLPLAHSRSIFISLVIRVLSVPFLLTTWPNQSSLLLYSLLVGAHTVHPYGCLCCFNKTLIKHICNISLCKTSLTFSVKLVETVEKVVFHEVLGKRSKYGCICNSALYKSLCGQDVSCELIQDQAVLEQTKC